MADGVSCDFYVLERSKDVNSSLKTWVRMSGEDRKKRKKEKKKRGLFRLFLMGVSR
jgi:hypothetical protein